MLPAGLSFSSGGLISGTPIAAGGPTTVTFQVTDSMSTTATKSLSITVVNNDQTTTPSAPTTGGGDGPSTPTIAAGVTTVTSVVNAQGVFNQAVDALSDDNKVLLHISAGAVGLSANGAPLTQISIVQMTTPPAFPSGAGMEGLAYDFTPSGTTFNLPAIIRFSYDPTLIPTGVPATSLQIAYYDNTTSSWITLTTTSVDTSSHFIYAQITHFTPYALTYGVKAMTPSLMATAPTITTTPVGTTTSPQVITTTYNTTPITTTPPTQTEPSSTPTASEVKTIIQLPTANNNPPSNNISVFRMYILAAAIGIALFLATGTATFVWLRHRDIRKKSGRLN
jgi:hypothetical protein